MDPSHYGNVKCLSIQHYLVKKVDTILTILDSNSADEKYAVLAMLGDWIKAFDRQDPRLGIQSVIQNGVRASMFPILISFFKNRKIIVKWHGLMSSERELPVGGSQGSTFGLLDHKSNSNSNADHIQQDSGIYDKFLPPENIQPQANLNQLANWTRKKQNEI